MKISLFYFPYCLLILISDQLYAQNTYKKSYDYKADPEFSYLGNIVTTPDSGYLLCCVGFNSSINGVALFKTDLHGNVEWSEEINDSLYVSETNAAIGTDGSIYVTYPCVNIVQGYYGIACLKLNQNGSLLWAKQFGQAQINQRPEKLYVDSNSIYISGELEHYNNGNANLFLIKLTSDGNLLWGKEYDYLQYDWHRAGFRCKNGDFILSGISYIYGGNDNYSLILRINSDGQIIWNKNFYTEKYLEYDGQAITETSTGNILITGRVDTPSTISGFGLWDIFLEKLSSDGDFQWGKIYGGVSYDEGYGVLETDDRNYLVCIEPESLQNSSQIGLLKTDTLGNTQWIKTYVTGVPSFPFGMVKNNDQGFTVFGILGNWNEIAPIVIIRTDSNGVDNCSETSVQLQQGELVPAFLEQCQTSTISGINVLYPYIHTIQPELFSDCESLPLGINTTHQPDTSLLIHPNPSANIFTVNLYSEQSFDITIRNMLGQTIFFMEDLQSSISFGEKFSPGIYSVSICLNKKYLTTTQCIKY